MELIVRNQALERDLETIITWYHKRHPAEAEIFNHLVADESAALVKPSAMSADGHMLNFAKLPCTLYSIIKHAFAHVHNIDDFFCDQDNWYLLCKVWQNARIKRKPTPRLFKS